MWLTDLQKAVAILLDRGYTETLVRRAVPSSDSRVLAIFYTTYLTKIFVFKNGLITEYEEE